MLTRQMCDSQNQRVNAASALKVSKMTVGKQCGWILFGSGVPEEGRGWSRELWRLIKPVLAQR